MVHYSAISVYSVCVKCSKVGENKNRTEGKTHAVSLVKVKM